MLYEKGRCTQPIMPLGGAVKLALVQQGLLLPVVGHRVALPLLLKPQPPLLPPHFHSHFHSHCPLLLLLMRQPLSPPPPLLLLPHSQCY